MQTNHPRSRIILKCLDSGCKRLPPQTSGLGKHWEGILYNRSCRDMKEFWQLQMVEYLNSAETSSISLKEMHRSHSISQIWRKSQAIFCARISPTCNYISGQNNALQDGYKYQHPKWVVKPSMHIPSRFPDTLWQNSISRLFLASYRRFFMLTLARLATDQNICDRLILV
jgi:hypothetical protein